MYFFSDYANRGVGGFDGYCGEPYLFMDELKQDSLPFELLLTITQGYRSQMQESGFSEKWEAHSLLSCTW